MMMYYRANDDFVFDINDPSCLEDLDASIMIRTADNPWGPWEPAHEVQDCSEMICYGSYMHPDFVTDNHDNTHTIHFIMSLMHLPSTGDLWDCYSNWGKVNQSYPYRPPEFSCNWVYNTFLMSQKVSW